MGHVSRRKIYNRGWGALPIGRCVLWRSLLGCKVQRAEFIAMLGVGQSLFGSKLHCLGSQGNLGARLFVFCGRGRSNPLSKSEPKKVVHQVDLWDWLPFRCQNSARVCQLFVPFFEGPTQHFGGKNWGLACLKLTPD